MEKKLNKTNKSEFVANVYVKSAWYKFGGISYEQKDDVLRRISLVYVKKGAIFCQFRVSHLLNVNPLQPGVVHLYPLKTSENLGGIDKQHQAVMG